MATPFENAIIMLDRIGLFDVVLPFIFIFVIVFATFQKLNILAFTQKDKNATKIHAIVAFVCAMTFVAFAHFVTWLYQFLIGIVIVMIAVICLRIIIGMMGTGIKMSSWVYGIVAVAFLGILIYSFGVDIDKYLQFLKTTPLLPIVVAILVFGGIVWYITSPGKEKTSSRHSSTPSAPKKEESKPAPKSQPEIEGKPGKKIMDWDPSKGDWAEK